jgi:hypothetical protein
MTRIRPLLRLELVHDFSWRFLCTMGRQKQFHWRLGNDEALCAA